MDCPNLLPSLTGFSFGIFRENLPLRHTFNKLGVAEINRHSLMASVGPHGMKRLQQWGSLICQRAALPTSSATCKAIRRSVRSLRFILPLDRRLVGDSPPRRRSLLHRFQSLAVSTRRKQLLQPSRSSLKYVLLPVLTGGHPPT